MRHNAPSLALALALLLGAAPLVSQGPSGGEGYEVWLSAREGVSRIAIARISAT